MQLIGVMKTIGNGHLIRMTGKKPFLKENILPIQESGQLKFIEVMQSIMTD